MKHLTPYRQNETSLSPVRGKGMVYGGGHTSEYSTEIFQVEIHQTCIVVLVFLCKETEFVTLVEPRCCSERIYCYKATTCSISMSKYVLHTIKYESAYSLASILFVYSQTSYFNGGITRCTSGTGRSCYQPLVDSSQLACWLLYSRV